MITDKERHEVAKKLRELPIDVYEVEGQWKTEGISTDCHDQTDYYLIHDVLLECLPAEYMHPGDYEELHERLADLIDRPTCEMAECSIDHGSRSWGMRCSRCGTEFEHERPAYGWRYCPKCGAMVVEKEGDDY